MVARSAWFQLGRIVAGSSYTISPMGRSAYSNRQIKLLPLVDEHTRMSVRRFTCRQMKI